MIARGFEHSGWRVSLLRSPSFLLFLFVLRPPILSIFFLRLQPALFVGHFLFWSCAVLAITSSPVAPVFSLFLSFPARV